GGGGPAGRGGARPRPGRGGAGGPVAGRGARHVPAVAADNLALECMPLDFREGRFLHFWLIPCFGMPIGELWWLDDLAAACARDRRWTFQLVSAPLHVRGGVGSPPDALALPCPVHRYARSDSGNCAVAPPSATIVCPVT